MAGANPVAGEDARSTASVVMPLQQVHSICVSDRTPLGGDAGLNKNWVLGAPRCRLAVSKIFAMTVSTVATLVASIAFPVLRADPSVLAHLSRRLRGAHRGGKSTSLCCTTSISLTRSGAAPRWVRSCSFFVSPFVSVLNCSINNVMHSPWGLQNIRNDLKES